MAVSKMAIAAASVVAIGAIGLGGAAIARADTTSSTPSSSSSAAPGYGPAGRADGGPGGVDGQSGVDGPGGVGGPGQGGSQDTPVTGDELAKVTAAVKAEDSSVTVSRVQKDPDGSYDVFGTKSGAPVMFEVSSDLKTVSTPAPAQLLITGQRAVRSQSDGG